MLCTVALSQTPLFESEQPVLDHFMVESYESDIAVGQGSRGLNIDHIKVRHVMDHASVKYGLRRYKR